MKKKGKIRINKKVLFIMRLPPPYGGGETLNKIVFNALRGNKNYHFVILKRKRHNKTSQANPNFYTLLIGIYYIFKIIIAILRYNPSKIHLSLPKSFGAFFRNAIIIHFSYLLKKEVIAELHGMNFYFINKKHLYKFYLSTINKVDKLRVLSNSVKETIIKTGYKNKIVVIDNGIYVPDQCAIVKRKINEPLRILYFGAISKLKGFEKVLKIVSFIKKEKLFDFKLTVVGEWVNNSFKNECEKFIKENKISSEINFKGILLEEEKWNVISQNHLLLHLSEFDGQPLTIIETMGLGIPTIATKVGAIPEMITTYYNGFLVDGYFYDSISTLRKIINKEINYELISKNTRDTYNKRYREELYIRNIEKFLHI